MISKDDGLASRFSRACFLYLNREIQSLERRGFRVLHDRCGTIQFPRKPSDEFSLERAVAQQRFPREYVQWCAPRELAERFSWNMAELKTGAAFFPSGGWVNPASLTEARLGAACVGRPVRVHTGVHAAQLLRIGGEWEVRDRAGEGVSRAPVVILAHGDGVMEWAHSGLLRLKRVRGQVTHVDAAACVAPEWVVCGEGYVTPPVHGIVSVGASYDFSESTRRLLEPSGRENLRRLAGLVPGNETVAERFAAEGRVGFRTLTADRLPVLGRLADPDGPVRRRMERLGDVPRLPGLYGFLGLGSRGVLWSGLGGECLAAQIAGEPCPVERDILDALDPARWVLRSAPSGAGD